MGANTYVMDRTRSRTTGSGRRYPISRPVLAARPYQAHRQPDRRAVVAGLLTFASELGVLLLMFAVIVWGLPVLVAATW